MTQLGDYFRRNLAQTSDAPIGLEISRADGSWLIASDGRRYLDFIAGIGVSALGHGNPEVLDAIAAQARRHLHVMVYGEYVIESQVMLARRLVELLPRPLERVYFTNSGAEAIECALKVARKFTGRAGFVAFDGAYHGDTMGALCSRNEVLGTLSHDPPLGHITTFGGHPLSCAAGLASLNVIGRERLCERSATIGKVIVRRILAMRAPEIAAVRGLGLLIGIE